MTGPAVETRRTTGLFAAALALAVIYGVWLSLPGVLDALGLQDLFVVVFLSLAALVLRAVEWAWERWATILITRP